MILENTVRAAESSPEIIDEAPLNVEVVTTEETVSEGVDEMWLMRRKTESTVRHYAEVKFTVTSRTTTKGMPFCLIRISYIKICVVEIGNLGNWKLYHMSLRYRDT